jgi:predicted transcriptional regulator
MRGRSAVDTNAEAPYAGFHEPGGSARTRSETDPARGRDWPHSDQIALDLSATSVEHDEWFRAEVDKGRAAAREGRLIEHDDVAARMDRRYRGVVPVEEFRG